MFSSGLEEIRTLDLIIANDALYQLSYEPNSHYMNHKKIRHVKVQLKLENKRSADYEAKTVPDWVVKTMVFDSIINDNSFGS